MKKPVRQKKRATHPRPAPAPAAAARPLRGVFIARNELQQLQQSLREAQETLEAIRSGEVDAVVVSGANGDQVYSLTGAEQPYRVYVERMQEGAVTVSSDGLILYCNQRFADMLGLPLERVISANLRDYVPADAWTSLAQVFAGGDQPVKHESQLAVAAGQPRPVTLSASPLPMEQRAVMCLVVTDLTVQKQHAELQLAKELAERANQSKDAFLAALSHELRTPLNPALMCAIALEQDATLAPKLRADLGLIRRNIELEARLIDDLLDLTRIAQGKLQLQIVPMDLHAAVRRAVEICEGDIRAKEIRLDLALTAGATETRGDPVRVQQAVWNLLTNSAKFTPRGGRISVRSRNPTPEVIEIEVHDTGIGFDPALASKLFDAFEQGGSEIPRQFGGLGLGLAITRSIALAHGGTVNAHSLGSGRGAVFQVQLPLVRPLAGAGASDAKEPDEPVTAPGVRILLVEDHRDTRTTMELLLKKSNFHVAAAETAAEALALAERETFDLVITDLGLPDRSGLELMKELRQRYGLRGIATSGYGMEEDVADCYAAGFDHHLTKPIKLAHLRRLIAEMHALPAEKK